MQFNVVTLFPEMVEQVASNGVVGRAKNTGVFGLTCWNPRDYTQNKHRSVDDRPYGGGPGMVMTVQPLQDTLLAIEKKGALNKVVYLSPQGKVINQQLMIEASQLESLTLVCGRYEGIDQRFIDQHIDEEWSLGDYVLSGGELAAMVCVDAIVRHLPGALGSELSAQQDSFSDGLLDCPHYTRPEEYQGQQVPEVLLNGHHKDIEVWRLKQALGQTWLKRPDLLEQKALTEVQQKLLQDFIDEQA